MATKKIQIIGSMTSGTVRHDIEQDLTEEEKEMAKKNIGAASVQFITWEEND